MGLSKSDTGGGVDNFSNEFKSIVNDKHVDWSIRGLLAGDDKIYPFGSDTKVLSTIFELFCAPLVREIARKHGYHVEEAPQTIYPDFTLLKTKADKEKIAVDIKTTYRRGSNLKGKFVYTLGSYTSFIRNGTKNILYPLNHYKKHWIIGFLYTRNNSAYEDTDRYCWDDRCQIGCPYKDVEFFVQEKYKIAGERPGSGNTTNIASFPATGIGPLERGEGPFARHGEDVFLDYWRNYEPVAKRRTYTNVAQFLSQRNNE